MLRDGSPLPLGGPRQRALLALLLLRANEVVSSDRLLDELWPEEPPLAGRAALRVRVSQLRKALGRDVVATRTPGYVLEAEPNRIDLRRFERLVERARAATPESAAELLREALALWRGEPLADLAYEPFARAEIARLEELRLAALELRVEADLALGRHAELVPELEAAVAREPLREGLRAHLMLALYRAGRQAEALDAYRDARRALLDELGLEPGRTLHELEAAILRHDAALDAPDAPLRERPLLVAVQDEDALDGLLALGAALAETPARELIVARLVPPGGDLAADAARLRERTAQLPLARVATFTTRAAGADLARLATEQETALALLDLADDGAAPALFRDAPCDTAFLLGRARRLRAGDVVAVPFGGAEHDWAAVELAAWLAGASGATLALVGTLPAPETGERDASRLLATASLIVQRVTGIVAEPRLAAAGAEAIAAAIPDAALVVAGLSPRWRREGVGAERLELARRAGPLLLVRKGLRPGGLAPPETVTRFTWSLAGG